jgi:hypothetical protein
MYFSTKSYLKSNYNHNLKQHLKKWHKALTVLFTFTSFSTIVIKPSSGLTLPKNRVPSFMGQPIKPGLFKGKVRLKIKNREGRQ